MYSTGKILGYAFMQFKNKQIFKESIKDSLFPETDLMYQFFPLSKYLQPSKKLWK